MVVDEGVVVVVVVLVVVVDVASSDGAPVS
jgi:hypothetical protein